MPNLSKSVYGPIPMPIVPLLTIHNHPVYFKENVRSPQIKITPTV